MHTLQTYSNNQQKEEGMKKTNFKRTKKLRILIIENNPVDRKLLQRTLSKSPYGSFIIQTANSLEGAFSLLSKNKTDVALLDLNLEDCKGLDTLKKLRENYPDIPVVVNTGAYQDDMGLKVVTKGAQDYLIKGKYNPYSLVKSIYYAIERKKAEDELQSAYLRLKDTQSQLIQAEKMNVIGGVASGVAHEVKNPLATILYGIEFLKIKIKNNDEKINLTIESITKAANNANTIIKGLLDFASLSQLKIDSEDLNDVIEQSLRLTKHQCDRNSVKIVKKFDPDLPRTLVDKIRIEQVLVDVILNAIHAMKEDGGILTITTCVKKFTARDRGWDRRQHGRLSLGDKVIVVDIDDTGPGICEENLSKIFDPFFTTRRADGGVGLGLSISRTIMKNHDGFIRLDNKKNGGARARLIFKM